MPWLVGPFMEAFLPTKLQPWRERAGTGKTFFCLSVVRNFLDLDPNAGVIYFETESAISRNMVESRGIDSKRMVIFPVNTVEEFRTQAVRIIDKYMETPKDERKPLMFVLDSLGMLPPTKKWRMRPMTNKSGT